MPLLARLSLLVSIAVLPALAILLYNGHDLRREREAQLHQEVSLYARAAADEVERVVDGARDLLVTIAHAPAVRDANWPTCNSYLAELGGAYRAYSRLTIADREGRIVCASTPIPVGHSMAERAYFAKAIAGEEFTIGRFTVGRRSGDAILPFAAPFHDRAGQIAGAVIVGLRLDWLTGQVEQKALPPNGSLLIADADGTILARSPDPEHWIGQPIRGNWRPLFQAARPGTSDVIGPDGVHRICGYVPPRASPVGLHVVAGLGIAQAMETIETASNRALILVALAGLLAMAATWFVGGRFIVRPIRQLITVAYGLGIGDDRCAALPARWGEFGALNRAVRDMARTLASRERALRASERRFQRLSDSTIEGVAIHDGERVLEANAAAARLFGREPDDVIGRTIAEFTAPETREQALANAREKIETPYESVGLRKDGSTFPVEVCGRAIEYDGRPMRVVIIRDLTGRKRAEAALRASEAEFRAIFEMADLGKAVADVATRRFLRVNRAFCEITGYTAEELLARTPQDIVHPDDWAADAAAFGRLIAGDDPVYDREKRYIRKDGSVIWARVNLVVLRDHDGRPARTMAVIENVTRHKQAEEALRQAETRYRLAARATNDAIWDWVAETNRIQWNEAVCTMFGYVEADVEPTMQWWKDRLHPDDRTRVLDGLRAVVRGTGQTWSAEYRFRKADGSWADVLDRGFMVRAPDGTPVRMIGAILDFTERKRAERRLKLLMAEVDHRAKNMLARVLVLMRTTRADTVQDFAMTTQGRIRALARAHTLLADNRWSGADLRRLVEEEMAPFRPGDEARVRIIGPHVILTPRAAQTLAMVLHELATNALKYGALSRPSGSVDVAWTLEQQHLTLRWAEAGGPLVRPPARRGTGTTVIERSVKYELDGDVRLDWAPDGLACALIIPAAQLLHDPCPRVAEQLSTAIPGR